MKCLFYSPWIVSVIIFLFLVKRGFGNSRERWFLIRIICETRIGSLIQRELWFSFMLFLIFREKKLKIQLFNSVKQISSLINDDSSDNNIWFCIRRRWCQASTSKQTIQKLENGKDIEQGSSSAVVLNQSKKNGSYGRIYCPWNVKRSFYFLYVINNPPPPLLPSYIMITRTWLINAGSMLLLRNEAGIIPTSRLFKQGNVSWE